MMTENSLLMKISSLFKQCYKHKQTQSIQMQSDQNNRFALNLNHPLQKQLFSQSQKEIVLFAYDPSGQDSPQEIEIMSSPKKRRKRELSAVQYITQCMKEASLEDKQIQSISLKKLDNLQFQQISKQLDEILTLSHDISKKERKKRRKVIFQSSRQKERQHFKQYYGDRVIRVVKIQRGMEGLCLNQCQMDLKNLLLHKHTLYKSNLIFPKQKIMLQTQQVNQRQVSFQASIFKVPSDSQDSNLSQDYDETQQQGQHKGHAEYMEDESEGQLSFTQQDLWRRYLLDVERKQGMKNEISWMEKQQYFDQND